MRLFFLIFFGLTRSAFSQCDDFVVDIYYSDPTCFGFTDGTVTGFPSGGEEPYLVEITDEDGTILNGGGAITANLLPEGWYYVWVVDAAGCEFLDSVELSLSPPIDVETYTIIDHEGPGTCNGSITIEDIPGHDIASLYFYWSPDLVDGMSGLGANEYTSACPGDYVVTINDDAGCSAVFVYTVGGVTTEIDEINTNLNFVVTTNNNNWTVTNNHTNTINSKIRLFDLLGQQVYTTNLNQGINNFELEQNGVLIYQIIVEGEILQSGKVSN